MSGVKRPGEGEGPDSSKKAYGGPSADLMDAEPELPEEYEDPDDDDVFLNDVMDQKVRDGVDRSVPSFFQTKPRPSQPRLIRIPRTRSPLHVPNTQLLV